MNLRSTDPITVGGLGAGAAYLNWVSTYGTAVVTTLAILVALVTLVTKVQELRANWRKRKEMDGDVPDEHSDE